MKYPDGYIPTAHDAPTYKHQPIYRRDRELFFPIEGKIINVYTSDHPNNALGRTLVDIECVGSSKTLYRVPVGHTKFHKETGSNANSSGYDLTDNRQILEPRAVSIYNGFFFTPEVGDIVVVQFINGNYDKPFISHYLGTDLQSIPDPTKTADQFIFPREAHYMSKFAPDPREDGMYWSDPIPHFHSRIEGTESESPRMVGSMAGTTFEITNKGTFHIQTAIQDTPPQNADRYDDFKLSTKNTRLVEKPSPEGDIIFGTTGATKGRIGLITGQFDTGEDAASNLTLKDDYGIPKSYTNGIKKGMLRPTLDGTILLYTDFAMIGNIQFSAQDCPKGNIKGKTSRSLEGNISFISDDAQQGNHLYSAQRCPQGNIDMKTDASAQGNWTTSTNTAASGNITGHAITAGVGNIIFNTSESGSGDAHLVTTSGGSGNARLYTTSGGQGNATSGTLLGGMGTYSSGSTLGGIGNASCTTLLGGIGNASYGSSLAGVGTTKVGTSLAGVGKVSLGCANCGMGGVNIFSKTDGIGGINIQSELDGIGGIYLNSDNNPAGDIQLMTSTDGKGDISIKTFASGSGQVYLGDKINQSFHLDPNAALVNVGTQGMIFLGKQGAFPVFIPPIPIPTFSIEGVEGSIIGDYISSLPKPTPIINSVTVRDGVTWGNILYEALNLEIVLVYNSHTHGGVFAGGSHTAQPDQQMILINDWTSEVVWAG